MGTKLGAFSGRDATDALGELQAWRGAGFTRATTLAPDRSRPRQNFSDGAIEDVWDVNHPRTPGPAGGHPLPPIRDRGGMGFAAGLTDRRARPSRRA